MRSLVVVDCGLVVLYVNVGCAAMLIGADWFTRVIGRVIWRRHRPRVSWGRRSFVSSARVQVGVGVRAKLYPDWRFGSVDFPVLLVVGDIVVVGVEGAGSVGAAAGVLHRADP